MVTKFPKVNLRFETVALALAGMKAAPMHSMLPMNNGMDTVFFLPNLGEEMKVISTHKHALARTSTHKHAQARTSTHKHAQARISTQGILLHAVLYSFIGYIYSAFTRTHFRRTLGHELLKKQEHCYNELSLRCRDENSHKPSTVHFQLASKF